MWNLEKMTRMYDPDFDPYQDLQDCFDMIVEHGKAIEQLAQIQSVWTRQTHAVITNYDTLTKKVQKLEENLNEIKRTSANNSQ